VLIVHNNPWNVSVCWVEGFSLLGHLDYEIDSFLAGGTLVDDIPVKVVKLGTFPSVGIPVVRIGFKADDEGKSLSVKVVFLDGTSLNKVALALSRSMLAGKSPAGSILNSFGISIWIEVEVADFPEVLSLYKDKP
jgi:hypothetical protein